MNNPEDAFIDQPPAGFAPFNQKTLLLISRACRRAGVAAEEVEILGAYACVSTGLLSPTADEIVSAFNDLPDGQVDAIVQYMNRVQARKEAASFEVEAQPGKPRAGAVTHP